MTGFLEHVLAPDSAQVDEAVGTRFHGVDRCIAGRLCDDEFRAIGACQVKVLQTFRGGQHQDAPLTDNRNS